MSKEPRFVELDRTHLVPVYQAMMYNGRRQLTDDLGLPITQHALYAKTECAHCNGRGVVTKKIHVREEKRFEKREEQCSCVSKRYHRVRAFVEAENRRLGIVPERAQPEPPRSSTENSAVKSDDVQQLTPT